MASQVQLHQGPDNSTNESQTPTDLLREGVFDGSPSYNESGLGLPDYERTNGPSALPAPPVYRASQPQDASAVSNLNRPSFCWEMDARTILQGWDFYSIQQILRFRLYGHADSLRHALKYRWAYSLDQILLLRPNRVDRGHRTTAELKKDRKVEEILESVESTRLLLPMGWSWVPYKATGETDTEKIAADIDEESCSLFRKVPFENWLRYSVGYEEESVDELFFLHECLSRRLHSYLRRHHEETKKYVEVMKELGNQSSLAHQALSHCLVSLPLPMPVSRLPFELEIITGPLRRVFQTRTLKATLPILPILAIRFDLTFHSILDVIDWTREFRTDLAVYKTLIADDPVKQLAMKATMSDKQGFDLLCPAGFKKRDIHLIRLNYQSNAITTGLAECCMAHPPLMYRVREMAEEFFRLCNWHRLAAILVALRAAHFDESTLPEYFGLICPDDNYAAFRAHMKARPGLPFLLPYQRQYVIHGEATLSEVFSFASYNIEVVAQSGSSTRDSGFMHHFFPCIYR